MSLLLLESTGSTQDELVARLRAGEEIDGVAAGQQTAGRGRFGRAWDSPAGESVALSVSLRMPARAHEAPYIGMALAARVARRYSVAVQWPNDVTFGGRKLGGILIEGMEIRGEKRLIVGVGLNLNQTHFPEEIAHRATSIKLVQGQEFDWREAAETVYELAKRPCPPNFFDLSPLWLPRDETVGKRYRKADGTVGIARGIDALGHLLLEGEVEGVPVVEAYFGERGIPE